MTPKPPASVPATLGHRVLSNPRRVMEKWETLLGTDAAHPHRALLLSPSWGRVGSSGVTHGILEAGPQVLHGIVELSLLPQGSKDEALDVLEKGDSGGGGGQGS